MNQDIRIKQLENQIATLEEAAANINKILIIQKEDLLRMYRERTIKSKKEGL